MTPKREQRRTVMPLSAAFYADMTGAFGKPAGFAAEEGGERVAVGREWRWDEARTYRAFLSGEHIARRA